VLLNLGAAQDHRAVKRIVRPMMGFKSFWCAANILADIETVHMIRKEQLECADGQTTSAADRFYSLAY
jgi:putative transposase